MLEVLSERREAPKGIDREKVLNQALGNRIVAILGTPNSEEREKILNNLVKEKLKSEGQLQAKALNEFFKIHINDLRSDPDRAAFKNLSLPKDGRDVINRELVRIDAILKEAETTIAFPGIPIRGKENVLLNLRKIGQWIDELNEMLRKPQLLVSPESRRYVEKVRTFFLRIINTSPAASKFLPKPKSEVHEHFKGQARFTALVITAGLLLISGVSDYFNKQISGYSMLMLGLMAGIAGVFKGSDKVTAARLAFLPTARWEQLRIRGEDWQRTIDVLVRAHKRPKAELKKHLKAGDTAKYIEEVAKSAPEAERGKVRALLSRYSIQDLKFIDESIRAAAGDPASKQILDAIVRKGVTTKTVATELKRKPVAAEKKTSRAS